MDIFIRKALALFMTMGLAVALPSQAETIAVDFSGVLTSAVNNVYDDPDIPSTDFFKVGQAFSGTLLYDTKVPGFTESGDAFFELQGFSITIGDTDFSSRFLPRSIFRSSDGFVSFSTGGADQGGGASISLVLPSFYGNYPQAGELDGKTASFQFSDFYPLGGQVAGVAQLYATDAVGAVPELETWIIMIFGMGTVGCALRRRRRASLSTNLVVLPA